MYNKNRVNLVLFDLDGTLADTAPDLAYALNQTLKRHGRPPLPFNKIRPHVSHGGVALIRAGFELEPEHVDFTGYRQDFLAIYEQNISRETTLFPGMEEVLITLEEREIAWGIVTNKPSWLTNPLMEQMGLTQRAACIISGDTTKNSKPHPGPILHACEEVGYPPEECIYIGDAARDIEAGNRAGATTIIARFGYIAENDNPETWGADGGIVKPRQILEWV